MTDRDQQRLELLDRIADRVPELDLDQQEVAWTTLDDGAEALLVNGGGIDGGNGAYFANHGEDIHAVGTLAPIIDGCRGCIVIRPDGSCYVAQVMPDPSGGALAVRPLAQAAFDRGLEVLAALEVMSSPRARSRFGLEAGAGVGPDLGKTTVTVVPSGTSAPAEGLWEMAWGKAPMDKGLWCISSPAS